MEGTTQFVANRCHTTASVALKRLVACSAKNGFYRANRDLGRIFKTEFLGLSIRTAAPGPDPAWPAEGRSTWGTVTVIAALGLDSVRAPLAFPGSTDTAAFRTYVEQVLVPEWPEGEVVVFDNLKTHLSAGVAASIEGAGALVLPLPPYSPDSTPIEEIVSKVKQGLRWAGARAKAELDEALGEALRRVTPEDILGWFRHAGLCATHG
jgi:transposase